MEKFHQRIVPIILSGLGFIFVYMPPTISAATLVTQDIGLRLREDGENIPIAVQPAAASTSPLKIYKNGVVYGIKLVPLNHPAATKLRIKLPSGQTMAVQRVAVNRGIPRLTGA